MKAIIGTRTSIKWLEGFSNFDPSILKRLKEIYGTNKKILESRRQLYLQVTEAFIKAYGSHKNTLISRAPGRINLLGNHIDHRGGYLNYMTFDRETLLMAAPRNDDLVVMHNANPNRFSPRSFEISKCLPQNQQGNWMRFIEEESHTPKDWGNYIKAAVLYLQDQFPNRSLKGMDIAIAGDVPIGAGLSSSSTLVVTALEAALAFNQINLQKTEKAEFCGRAEWYVGTRGGAGDHAAMLFGKRNSILHFRFFPIHFEPLPFPDGYQVVACNSFVEHQSTSIFNERVATYEIGLQLVKKNFPHYSEKLIHLRDLNSEQLGSSSSEIYHMLKSIPQRMSRQEIHEELPNHCNFLDSLFAQHQEPEEGYRVRQVLLFGLGECARGNACGTLLREGNMTTLGELKYRSHDGDRQFTFTTDGKVTPLDNRISDSALDELIADLESNNSDLVESAQLTLQPGGYDCSCKELDHLVDLAKTVDGVVGAGLSGGGLGGCVLVIAKEGTVKKLIQTLNKEFYKPRKLNNGTLVCNSVAGSSLI